MMTGSTAEATVEVVNGGAAPSEVPAAPAPLGLDDLTKTPGRPIPIRQINLGRFATPKGRYVTAKRRRRVRVDWYLIGVLLLMLSSAAVCIYRLIWATYP